MESQIAEAEPFAVAGMIFHLSPGQHNEQREKQQEWR